jgi:GAF domain-containing protein
MGAAIDVPADSTRVGGLRSPPAPEAADGARAVDAGGGLGFPDMPRLELDQLLVQLRDRADDVLAAQGRLRGLLHANALVAAELSLPVVLRQIVAAARDLVGARYAALGVVGADGEVEQFVHADLDEELAAAAGDPTRGGHPPMTGFLGVPVRIGAEVFGNLYLTERARGGEFTADDEQLAIALAAAAGAAIANARRFAESEQRRRWLDASAELAPLLLSGEAAHSHALITRLAAAAADADFATVTVSHGADQVIVTSVAGVLAAGLLNQTAALADSPAGRVIRTGKPALVIGEDRETVAAALGAGTGPLIIVPLAGLEQVRGALMLGRLTTRPGYAGPDLEMAASFAGHAAVAMELAQARADQISLAQAEDRDHIAGELHDHVIQELFALGMTLQSHAARSDPATAARVSAYVGTLDGVIKKIRTSIFGLQQPRPAPASTPPPPAAAA